MRSIALRPLPAGHAAPITHVGLRADGRRLATGSYDGTVVVWDTSDPARPRRLHQLAHRRLVNATAWNPRRPDVLATASADKTAVVWRVGDDADLSGAPAVIATLARHTDDVNSISWMPDGTRLICVSEDGQATLWDALGGRFLAAVAAHGAHCMMVSVSRTGLVATVGEDGLVAVTDPDGGGSARRRYDSSVEGCAWSNAGDLLAVARDDGVVDLLDAELRVVRSVPVSSSAARCVAWADDDAVFAVGAYDGLVHVFGRSGTPVGRFDDPRAWPRSVAAAAGLLAVGSFAASPHLLDLASLRVLAEPAAPTHGANALAASRDRLLIGTDAGTLVSVDLATLEPSVVSLTGSPILSLAATDGAIFAGTYRGEVVRCDSGVVTGSGSLGAPLPSLLCHGGSVVAGTYNGELLRLDPATLALRERDRPHDGSVKSLAALSETAFVSASTDRTVALNRSVLWEHGNLVNAVATLGGRVVASASRDHTVKVGWLESGTAGEVRTLTGPDESVKAVGLLGGADAPVVLAGSYDFGLYCWPVRRGGDTPAGYLLATFEQAVSCIGRIDDRTVAVAGWDGRVLLVRLGADGRPELVVDLDVPDLVALASDRLVVSG